LLVAVRLARALFVQARDLRIAANCRLLCVLPAVCAVAHWGRAGSGGCFGCRHGPDLHTMGGDRCAELLLSRVTRCGTCYFAPNICSSPPSADDVHVVLQLDRAERRERDRRRRGGASRLLGSHKQIFGVNEQLPGRRQSD
jgi:hypothetical protein